MSELHAILVAAVGIGLFAGMLGTLMSMFGESRSKYFGIGFFGGFVGTLGVFGFVYLFQWAYII